MLRPVEVQKLSAGEFKTASASAYEHGAVRSFRGRPTPTSTNICATNPMMPCGHRQLRRPIVLPMPRGDRRSRVTARPRRYRPTGGRASAGGAWIAVSLLSASMLGAACGGAPTSGVASIGSTTSPNVGASPGSAGESADFTNALKYARCMRGHGEPDFPDPQNPGGFSTGALARLDTASPKFVSAENICRRRLPNDGQPTPAELQQAIDEGLRFARCMRAHHVEFPDPGISGDHMTINFNDIADPNSPQYLAAAQVCKTTPSS
ncbi:MAG: hypothetical protein JWO62_2845 [Acidimicrobiaceae bacterium]|nr:hypothetical protein [Acidimicrobiaceae bacterium]